MPKKKRSRPSRALEPPERRRLAKLARSFLPRGAAERDLGDAVRELVFLVGGAAGRAFGTWSEIPIRTFSLALADIDDEEALVRTVRIWRLVEALGGEDRRQLRREVARLLRERDEDDDAGGDHPVCGSGR